MTCSKCEAVMTQKEVAVGKGKCIFCLIKGYKFAMGRQMAETEKALKEVERLRKKLDNANLIIESRNRKIKRLEAELEEYEEE